MPLCTYRTFFLSGNVWFAAVRGTSIISHHSMCGRSRGTLLTLPLPVCSISYLQANMLSRHYFGRSTCRRMARNGGSKEAPGQQCDRCRLFLLTPSPPPLLPYQMRKWTTCHFYACKKARKLEKLAKQMILDNPHLIKRLLLTYAGLM